MKNEKFIISFQGESEANRGVHSNELKDMLVGKGINAVIKRSDPKKQDFGNIIEIVLNASAVVAAVKIIETWLKMRYSAKIKIKTKDGSIIAENITSQNAKELTTLLTIKNEKNQKDVIKQ